MSYSCTDFTDDILDALGIVVPDESLECPDDQAALALAEINRMKQLIEDRSPIAVILEGGLCQCVVSKSPLMVGRPYIVIDYDTDGADDDDDKIVDVEQADGSTSDAFVSGGKITEATIIIPVEGAPE